MGNGLLSSVLNVKRVCITLAIVCISLRAVAGASTSRSKKTMEVEGKINQLKRHVIKSIQSEDGDIIDCIDIYKQPAFRHPALRNHTIQMAPSDNPSIMTTGMPEAFTKIDTSSSIFRTSQLWRKKGSCPKGTIPIRRIQKNNMAKASLPVDYGRKKAQNSHRGTEMDENKIQNLLQSNHSMAILITEGYSYTGAKGDIKVFNPHVEYDDEWTTSQIALKSAVLQDYECVESGWAVNPGIYGDRKTRFFVYWTADSGKKTGCFDLTCPGFVQTSSKVALGAAIHPISTTDGLPYQITLYLFRDPSTGNWWVQYDEKTNVGYFPPELFAYLPQTAQTVQWGGEVYSSRIGGFTPHTSTQMGSGQFPILEESSGYVKRIRVRDNSMILKFPEQVDHYTDEYRCYDVRYLGDYIEDPEFYFGGPGRNELCP
ncbi:hypothetical protein ACJRO7_015728 [Eucalyptus globulus]|uniref:Neprosin PEP catalytic domain-containing protein n=1 Tax=Eucalyptus globulus TaxID=34317 RepID=A0ABD3L4M2_EUCGL